MIMRSEVMEFYGLTRPLRSAGYFETTHHKELLRDVKQAIYSGNLVVLSGVIGAGKTAAMTQLQDAIEKEGRVAVSTSVSIEKSRVAIGTLVTALFCDLSSDKNPTIPKSGELRDRALRNLVRKRKKPVVLFVDDAHDLNRNILIALKRLIELVEGGGAKLSVVLAGHPRLRNDLRETMMEEIGYRTAIYSLEGVTGSQRQYMTWLIDTCATDGVGIDDMLEPAAVDLLAARLRTPLQIEQHLTLALETGFQASEKPITEAIADSVLSKQIDGVEATLNRNGYTTKVLTEMLGVKTGELRGLFRNELGAERTRDLKEQMLSAGLPV
jgi:type II secretory pathway predicted ATPase ExeA